LNLSLRIFSRKVWIESDFVIKAGLWVSEKFKPGFTRQEQGGGLVELVDQILNNLDGNFCWEF